VGYPAPGTTGPILQDAVLRDMGHGDEVQAKSVSIADLSAGDFNDSFVSIEGRFLRRVEEPYRVVLLLQVANTLLLAELAEPESSKSFEGLKEGSRVRLSGISMLDADGVWNMDSPKASLIRYKLLLRSPADVQVTQPPSWWTINHVLYLALGFGVLALIFIGRDVYNRIEQWKRKAVLDERERMAFELHDTLAQSLAGIGFQLQAIRRGIPNEHPGLRQQVDVARALVQHSHKEARRTADPLGAEAATEIDLLSSLEECARAMVEGGSVEVRSASTGEKRPIPPPFRVGLLRIGQEAIANAVRHANPTKLEIAVAYSPACIRLSVLDDGCGFVKSGDLLGFGLRGMRKRAAALSARLEIESQPGAGTRVEVTAPLPPPPSISVVIKQSWKFILERVVHVKADRRPDSNPHRG
jgi:signal transduction histidine kinase